MHVMQSWFLRYMDGYSSHSPWLNHGCNMRNSKFGDNILPYELFCINIPDVRQWFSLYPLCEVVRPDEKPPSVPHCSWEWSNYVETPLCKWPWTRKRIQCASKLMDARGEPLTLVILLSIILGRFLHIRPSVSSSESPMW